MIRDPVHKRRIVSDTHSDREVLLVPLLLVEKFFGLLDRGQNVWLPTAVTLNASQRVYSDIAHRSEASISNSRMRLGHSQLSSSTTSSYALTDTQVDLLWGSVRLELLSDACFRVSMDSGVTTPSSSPRMASGGLYVRQQQHLREIRMVVREGGVVQALP